MEIVHELFTVLDDTFDLQLETPNYTFLKHESRISYKKHSLV